MSLKELMLQCNRCHHKWLRRTLTRPVQCPACKTPLWDKDRVRKLSPQRRAARRK
jgi:hypothetical protein